MKFKYLLLLAFSVWFVGITTTMAAPIRAVNRFTTAARFAPDADTAQDTYRNCQAISPAVVTVYAGNETGSGSIVTANGLVITSNHVVKDRGVQPVIARTADGTQYQGQVIKTDTRNDLALIQLKAQGAFPIVQLASTNTIEIGQAVCAIGSPYGRPGVLSAGTLSLVRGNGDLQANIRLYPGNSGGPLLNPQGEMIGVNKAILESPSGKNTGISFATGVQAVRNLIGQPDAGKLSAVVTAPNTQRDSSSATEPSDSTGTEWTWTAPTPPALPSVASLPNLVQSVLPRPTSPATRGQLGVVLDVRNLVVQRVQAGSAADMSGFRPGDRLVAINGQRLSNFASLQAFLKRQPPTATFTLDRARQLTDVRVTF